MESAYTQEGHTHGNDIHIRGTDGVDIYTEGHLYGENIHTREIFIRGKYI